MIPKEQYKEAVEQHRSAQKIIDEYHIERLKRFEERLKTNPIFTDDELRYSATERCPCGHGLAYPKECGVNHYWDCSAILKGIADTEVTHTDRLPFAFCSIKGESALNGTTRLNIKPGDGGRYVRA